MAQMGALHKIPSEEWFLGVYQAICVKTSLRVTTNGTNVNSANFCETM